MIGIVVKSISNTFTVKHNLDYYNCKARGRLRNENITPIVGDNVLFDEDKKIISEILPRSNEMIRPLISNVDQALVLVSVTDPAFSTNFLDKMLIITSFNKVAPIICLTKMDLLTFWDKLKIKKYTKYYRKIGYEMFDNKKLSKIKELVNGKITVITGQSGVGKSTLLNKLDENLKLKTDEVSKALKRGKHTTRHVELFELFGGFIADTPGFTSLDFRGLSKKNIRDNITEFNKYKDGCEYRDCFHINESNCNIKKMVEKGIIIESRYNNYKKFIKEVQ